MRSIRDQLEAHAFSEGLSDEQRELIAGCGRNAHFDPGAYLLREGAPADAFFLIRRGEVALEVASPHRGPIVVETLQPGEVLGWSWLFPPYTNAFDARAVSDVRAIAFDGTCLRGKCEQDHELGYQLMLRVARIFTARLAATRLQLLDLYGQPNPS